jgi:hypothetical protein
LALSPGASPSRSPSPEISSDQERVAPALETPRDNLTTYPPTLNASSYGTCVRVLGDRRRVGVGYRHQRGAVVAPSSRDRPDAADARLTAKPAKGILRSCLDALDKGDTEAIRSRYAGALSADVEGAGSVSFAR